MKLNSYLLSIHFLILRAYLKIYKYQSLEKIITIILLLLLLTTIFKKKFSKKELLIGSFVLMLVVITKNVTPFLFYIIIVLSKNENLDKILNIFFKTHLFYFISTILLCFFINKSFISGEITHYKLINGVLKTRYDLGFNNPNTTMKHFFPIVTSYMYLKRNKWNLKNKGIVILSTLLLFKLTYSYTISFGVLMTVVLLEMLKYINLKKIKILKDFFLILGILSLIVGLYFSKNIGLNNVLSGRANLWGTYLKEFKMSWLGSRIPIFYYETYPLDNSYFQLIYQQGILFFFTIFFIQRVKINNLIMQNNKIKIALAVLLYTVSFFESFFITIAFNPVLLILYSKQRSRNEESNIDNN